MNELQTSGPDQALVAVDFLRIGCSRCSKEVSMKGTREHFQSLLEHFGWRLGPRPLCKECVRKTAKEYMRRINE